MFAKRHRSEKDGFFKALEEVFSGFKGVREALKNFDVDNDIAHCPVGPFFSDVEMLTEPLERIDWAFSIEPCQAQSVDPFIFF